jgi:hypothetical protein
MTTDGGAAMADLSLNRIVGKAIQCFLVLAAIAFAACARVIPDVIGWRFWTLAWVALAFVTEPVAIILFYSARGSAEVSRPLAEWLRAAILAAIPATVLAAFWIAMWVTFRIP